MYKSFYGLSASPFSLLPDADFMYLSRKHRRAISLLEYGVDAKAGFVVITGDVGAGKTTIIRRFLKNVGQEIAVGVITNTSVGSGRLLRWVAMAFEIDDKESDDVTLYNRFVDYLLAQYGKGKRTVLIVDEAQNFSPALLEELRMLSNVNNEKDQLLQIILVGQPELLATLKQPGLRQFVQRITVHCHLEPLQAAETTQYIRHRLSVVGGASDIFSDAACAAVHYFTNGVPRLINLLCDQALVYGFAEDVAHINHAIIMEVVADRGQAGLSAFRPLAPDWTPARLLQELRGMVTSSRPVPLKPIDQKEAKKERAK
jgi:putative secretion ATPase (PEP-CTERM system associated)